jgi:histidinol phosphatase-like enzyme
MANLGKRSDKYTGQIAEPRDFQFQPGRKALSTADTAKNKPLVISANAGIQRVPPAQSAARMSLPLEGGGSR